MAAQLGQATETVLSCPEENRIMLISAARDSLKISGTF